METIDSDGSSSFSDEKFLNCVLENASPHSKHVVLPKNSVLEAIDAILQTKPDDKKAKPFDSLCMDRTQLPVYASRLKYRVDGNDMLPILSEMRHCVLTGDWDGYKELLSMFFKSPKLAGPHMVYCVRSCFVLLFNHPNRTAEMLDNFMITCLNINEESRRTQYLRECFTLKGSLVCAAGETDQNVDDKSEEDEEELFFNSEFSSD